MHKQLEKGEEIHVSVGADGKVTITVKGVKGAG